MGGNTMSNGTPETPGFPGQQAAPVPPQAAPLPPQAPQAPYSAPEYPAPQHPAAQYPAGQYPAGQYPPAPPVRPVNPLSIITLITGFFLGYIAIVLGVISLRQNWVRGTRGSAMSWVGIVFGAIGGVIFTLLLIIAFHASR